MLGLFLYSMFGCVCKKVLQLCYGLKFYLFNFNGLRSYSCFFFFFFKIPSQFVTASREKCYKQIQAAIAKFREIKDNINEGLKFYVTLQVIFNSVLCTLPYCYSSTLFL